METIKVEGVEFKAAGIPTETNNILLIQGSKGFLGCGYFSVETADKLNEAVAIVTGVGNYDDMLSAGIVKISKKAAGLGIAEGMSGKEALVILA